ncbi:DUF7139 domain-containing protein [Haloarchaeobius sp. HRN-SO-5]|uniref:DUF7139 domain-containing protein n=1 Tax=Haloarchaeobius sp. HRN-SO-5 TaxID=3446118 RepID=UPI003EC083DF
MTSLANVYENNVGEVESVRRFYLGVGLFAAGALLTLVGIVAGGTDLLGAVGVGVYDARKLAGVLGGLGVPAVLVGVFTVLPASERIRAAAAIGASVCVLGVALFWHAYPTYWVTSPAERDLTLLVAAVYSLGAFATVACLFSAVVTFKTRNDPGGTVTMHVTREGETRVVEVPAEQAEQAVYGGIGTFGETPDGAVETQTASTPASDGGASTRNVQSPLDGTHDDGVVLSPEQSHRRRNLADRYCGNCAYFDYVQTNRGMQPYCGAHDAIMDDMDACREWEPNN